MFNTKSKFILTGLICFIFLQYQNYVSAQEAIGKWRQISYRPETGERVQTISQRVESICSYIPQTNEFIIFAGTFQSTLYNDMYLINLTTGNFTQLSDNVTDVQPARKDYQRGFDVAGNLYFQGGRDSTNSMFHL